MVPDSEAGGIVNESRVLVGSRRLARIDPEVMRLYFALCL
jgi:hypothetical protein